MNEDSQSRIPHSTDLTRSAPCVLFEDEHLLVVNKPAGLNTHSPSPYAGQGIYEWLRDREPRWASLAIIHRLDKETSGVMVFAKTSAANRSLTEQFTQRGIKKKYLLLTNRPLKTKEFTARSKIIRAGERYVSGSHGEIAETNFKMVAGQDMIEAEPLTGRTHQIRVHAAEHGFPILGDSLYGGSPFARVCLHAAKLTLKHPANGELMTFRSTPDFDSDSRIVLRTALIDSTETNAYRIIHGASDGWPGWYVDRLGNCLLSQSETPPTAVHLDFLKTMISDADSSTHHAPRIKSAYHKILNRQVRRTSIAETSPQLILGEAAPERFTISENGVKFQLSFNEGYSVGLFLDQRENRRKFLKGYIAPDFPLVSSACAKSPAPEVLNTFAYTCGFSVCAALGGARTTSLDLSKKYLEWGKCNFALNELDASPHDFIYGDTFDWLKRFAKKKREFDVVVLDPPTFSQSKEHGAFQAEKDYGKLVRAALPVLKLGGVLLASTNAAGLLPEELLEIAEKAVSAAGRKILQKHYIPQPPDFPITRNEPSHLRSVWFRIA